MNKRRDIVYQLKRENKTWSCSVSWSVATGKGKTPMLAMKNWQSNHNKLVATGNKKLK